MSSSRYHDLPQDAEPVVTPSEETRIHEQLGWQMRTTRVLADPLKLAIRLGLPPVAWTVGSAGANLAGHCSGRTGADRRREFEAWRAAISAVPRPELTDFGGITHLRTIAIRYDGLVDTTVLADVHPADESEADR